MSKPWRSYRTGAFFDELMTDRGSPRVTPRRAINFFRGLSADELQARRSAAELAIKEMGISFTVHTEQDNIDREALTKSCQRYAKRDPEDAIRSA